MDTFSFEFLYSLPKAELHCHLDGSMRVDTIIDIAKKHGVSLPYTDTDSLGAYLKVGDSCKNLVDYLKSFAVTVSVLQDRDSLIRAVYELAEDASLENVRYLEIRYCPALSTQKGLTMDDVVCAMLEGKAKSEGDFNIIVNIIICALRHNSQEEATEHARLAVLYKDKGVVAFDIAGPENGYPAVLFQNQFQTVSAAGQHSIVHAGEACGSESVYEAVHTIGVKRIGHATSLVHDKVLMDDVRTRNICVEACVSCNVQVRAIDTVASHPVKQYLDAGICVTLNTDNRLLSDVTLTKEYKIVCDTFQLSKENLYTIIINGFRSALIPEKEKEMLLTNVTAEVNALGLVVGV